MTALPAQPTPTTQPAWSSLGASYAATMERAVSLETFQSRYPTACNYATALKRHRFLTMIVVHMTSATMPWWNTIQDERVNDQVITYEIALEQTLGKMSVFRFDAQMNDVARFSTNKPVEFAAYKASCCLGTITAGSTSQTSNLAALKQVFDLIYAEKDSDEVALQYYGHGNGNGGLFNNFLQDGPLVEEFFRYVTAGLPSQRFLFGWWASNCLEATDEVMKTRGPFFRYMTAASQLMGVAMDAATTMGFRLHNGWNQPVFPICLNPYRCLTNDNVIQALAFSMDVWRNIWCLGARRTITTGSIQQIITLFQCDGWLQLLQRVSLASSRVQSLLTGVRVPQDLTLFLESQLGLPTAVVDSGLTLYQVDTKDFFDWPQIDHGLVLRKPSNLLAPGFRTATTTTPMLASPPNGGLWANGKIGWSSVPFAHHYTVTRVSRESGKTPTQIAEWAVFNKLSMVDPLILLPGVSHTYRVFAIDAQNHSSTAGLAGTRVR